MAQAMRAVVVALFLFLFLFLSNMGSCCPPLLAADIGVTATSIAAVVFVGAVLPQAETKMAGQQQQQCKDTCIASAGKTTTTQRQSGVALTVQAMLALLRNVLVPALQQ